MIDLSKLFATVDVGKVEEIVLDIISAAPAIEKGLLTATPFVQALVEVIGHGGAPSEDEWLALRARLDAGTQVLDNAGIEAEAEVEAEAATEGAQTVPSAAVAVALETPVDVVIPPPSPAPSPVPTPIKK